MKGAMSAGYLLGALGLLLASCATNRLAVTGGQSDIGRDSDPVEEQVAIGFEYQGLPLEGGLGGEGGIRYGRDDGSVVLGGVPSEVFDVTSEVLEVYGGARYEWALDRFRPFLAGGMSAVSAEVSRASEDLYSASNDSDIGLYLTGGALFQVSDLIYLGASVRKTFGHDIGKLDIDATQILLTLAFGF